ncbi:hypothetical protein PIB30_065613 [Stylosanthes scabra]|uniref:Uncharacterized protein n=1 Tax=Stylosanthes scabra TaxID=79078 RepID=A0ABU6TMT4_9FABA|nr:hypothetical protein [Stylosanthes scabra]
MPHSSPTAPSFPPMPRPSHASLPLRQPMPLPYGTGAKKTMPSAAPSPTALKDLSHLRHCKHHRNATGGGLTIVMEDGKHRVRNGFFDLNLLINKKVDRDREHCRAAEEWRVAETLVGFASLLVHEPPIHEVGSTLAGTILGSRRST